MLVEITVIKSRPDDSEETKREEKKKEKRKEHHFYETICLLGGKKAFDSHEGYQWKRNGARHPRSILLVKRG